MSHDFRAVPYKGREWGVLHLPTRNWMIFGTRRACRRRAGELNGLSTSQHELCAAHAAALSRPPRA